MPRRVYLKDPELAQKSHFHTAYVGDGAISPDGKPLTLHKVEFVHGVARDVDDALYQRLKDAGVAETSRPRLPHTED